MNQKQFERAVFLQKQMKELIYICEGMGETFHVSFRQDHCKKSVNQDSLLNGLLGSDTVLTTVNEMVKNALLSKLEDLTNEFNNLVTPISMENL